MSHLVEKVADAILYEGYILYPYRASSGKNRQRWNFGMVYPRAYSEAQRGSDAWRMQTECLVRGGPETTLKLKVRFLRLTQRTVDQLLYPAEQWQDDLTCRTVASMTVGERVYQSWQEGVEHAFLPPDLCLDELVERPFSQTFCLGAERDVEPILDKSRRVVGALLRRREAIKSVLEISAIALGQNLYRIGAVLSNLTQLESGAEPSDRAMALPRSLASAHKILSVEQGEFISLLEPPQKLRDAADTCCNVGTWPVLAGKEGTHDTMLSSPIILYDYPSVAEESPGELCDGTEIDEILTLRIMTMTEDEKREMRDVDERARRILERTEALDPMDMRELHGTFRGVSPGAGRSHE